MTVRAAHKPGDVVGAWTLVEYVAGTAKPRREPRWLCRCSCGAQRAVQVNNLRRGASTSCGHDLAERMSEGMHRYHGMRKLEEMPVAVQTPAGSPWDVLSRYRQRAQIATEAPA